MGAFSLGVISLFKEFSQGFRSRPFRGWPGRASPRRGLRDAFLLCLAGSAAVLLRFRCGGQLHIRLPSVTRCARAETRLRRWPFGPSASWTSLTSFPGIAFHYIRFLFSQFVKEAANFPFLKNDVSLAAEWRLYGRDRPWGTRRSGRLPERKPPLSR